MKEKKKSLCHQCLAHFESNELYIVPMNEDGRGPSYTTGMCTKCTKARGKNPKQLETMTAYNKRLSKYLGLNV